MDGIACVHEWEQVWIEPQTLRLVGPFRCRKCRVVKPEAADATIATLGRLAKEATNGWACYAKRNIEHDDIARLHREIDAALAAPAAGTPEPIDTCSTVTTTEGQTTAGCGTLETYKDYYKAAGTEQTAQAAETCEADTTHAHWCITHHRYSQQSKFEGWAIVDMLGHQRHVGYVTTEYFGQTALFQVSTPAREARIRKVEDGEYISGHGYLGSQKGLQVSEGGVDATDRLIGAGSIFMLQPVSKDHAMAAIENNSARPFIALLDSEGKTVEPSAEEMPY